MFKTLAAFLLMTLMFNAPTEISCREVCEKYTYFDYTEVELNCTNYCCGTCSFRYCCSDLSDRLDQKKCTPENCDAYYDWYGLYYTSYNCNGRFCCGTCNLRYCCSSVNDRLNQSTCSYGPPPTTRRTTTTYYYNYNSGLTVST